MHRTLTVDPAAWHDATEAHLFPITAAPGQAVKVRLRTRLRPQRVQVLELRHGEILAFSACACAAPYPAQSENAQFENAQSENAQFNHTDEWYDYALTLGQTQTRYLWRLDVGDELIYVSSAGLSRLCPGYRDWFSVLPDAPPPSWVWESVFYQVFPDRFRRGSGSPRLTAGAFSYPRLAPETIEALSTGRSELERAALGAFELRTPEWDEPLSVAEDMHTRYGGDLRGVQDALPYLEALGINALWLNPIFNSPSSHRYDVSDYRTVDPHLGGEAAFDDLSAALRGRGMRLILDGVFNHAGNEHHLFKEALASPDSPERGYFTFRDQQPGERQPGELPYHGFYDVPTLPKLDYAYEPTYTEFIDGPDSIIRHWLRRGIDGWRLDVAQGMGESGTDAANLEIMRRLKRAARQENPEAYVVGERFFDAEHALQDGQGEDGVMNYHAFCMPVMAWFSGRDQSGTPQRVGTSELIAHLWDGYRVLPAAVALNQFNLLESHDIPRALFRLGQNTDRYLAALTLLLAYPGVPCLYYGGEIGLSQPQGDAMSWSRATFPWSEADWNHDLLGEVRRLVHLRRSLPALQRGSLRFVAVGQDCFALLRELAELAEGGGRLTRVMCLVSRSTQPVSLSIDLSPGRWSDLGSGAIYPGGLTELAWTGARLLRWDAVAQPKEQRSVGAEMH